MAAKEPTKYEKSAKGGHWVITKEWKEWARKQRQVEADRKARDKPKKPKREPITAENHEFVWREVAHGSGTEKKILFCACMRENGGGYYATCGAVGVQQSRSAKIEIMVEPRFE